MDQGVIDYIANVFDIPKLTQHVSAVQMPLPLFRFSRNPIRCGRKSMPRILL